MNRFLRLGRRVITIPSSSTTTTTMVSITAATAAAYGLVKEQDSSNNNNYNNNKNNNNKNKNINNSNVQQQQQQQQQKQGGLARYIDHTALKPETTRAEIEKLCEEAKEFNFASVCINPTFIPYAASLLRSSPHVKICTVIGFPLGANSTFTKCCETIESILNGANEIDFVTNIGLIKSKEWDKVALDMACVVLAAKYATQYRLSPKKSNLTKSDVSDIVQMIISTVEGSQKTPKDKKFKGGKVLTKFEDLSDFIQNYNFSYNNVNKDPNSICLVKVILETCLLTDEEIKHACQIAVQSKCDFVKTSTGFSTSGATAKHVSLMRKTVDEEAKKDGWKEGTIQVKASGGIRNAVQAKEMIQAGADRIGASKGVDIVREDSEPQKKK